MTAAGFWRWAIASVIALAAAVAVSSARLLHLRPLSAFGLGLLILALSPFTAVAASFVAARALTGTDASLPSSIRCSLRAWWSESLALGRAALTIGAGPWVHANATAPSVSRRASPVLLIHGILCDGSVWQSFRKRLEAAGYGPVRTVDLAPLFADIDSHAQTVAPILTDMQRDAGAPVAIVAHSMGGLVARAALRFVPPGVVSRLVTVASPHHGTVIARLFPQVPLRQMRPESPWLRALNQLQEAHLTLPVTSIFSAEDTLVAPARSAVLRGACMCELHRVGHLSLLTSGQTFVRALAALEAR